MDVCIRGLIQASSFTLNFMSPIWSRVVQCGRTDMTKLTVAFFEILGLRLKTRRQTAPILTL